VCRNFLPTFVPALLLGMLLCAFWLPEHAPAEENHCDPHLEQLVDNPFGYRLRDDRCEGVYIKEVGSTTLMVASLTEWFEDYDFDSDKDLLIKWAVPGNLSIRLRAQGLRRRLHYRMDTVRPSDTTTYIWPLNILAALRIQRKDIGVVGWTRFAMNRTERRVYLPLRVGQHPEPLGSNCYQIVLLPGRELTEVFVSLTPLAADGSLGLFLMDNKALKYGYYPAGRGIKIPICNFEKPGVYYLEIGATLSGGGTDTVELFFYYPGR
jgi:hypothetical protein